MGDRESVCVTGAGGYLASWLVKLLLSKGYIVHGTLRNPSGARNGHLKKLEHASENLQLFKADLLEYQSLCAAIDGCTGVFHVACPVDYGNFDRENLKEVEVIEPAVTGTRNVLNACVKAKVKKVVVVSSMAAVGLNPYWPKDQAMDEECWSNVEIAKAIQQSYALGKTIAEKEALEFSKSRGLNLVTVCPSIVIGPMLQSSINASSLYLLKFLKGEADPLGGGTRSFVDVRDNAEALLLLYEKPEAEGRYICSSYEITSQELVEMLKTMFPNYKYSETVPEGWADMKLTSKKLQNLGWKYRPFEQAIADAVNNFEEAGLLGD